MRDNDSLILEGAYLEVLEESRKKRYLEMFKGIPERFAIFSGKIGGHGASAEEWKQQAIDTIQQDIEWAIKNLKREDRILWYLRQIKIGLYLETDEILETLRKLYKKMRVENDEEAQRLADEYNKLVNDLPKTIRNSVAFQQFSPLSSADNISEYRNKLDNFFTHFLSMNIHEINNFRFENQNYEDILNKFVEIEKKWREKQKSWIDVTDELKEGKISPVVVFDDGFRWFNLNRPKCEEEGKAMGHCGNCGGRDDDTILSLRKLKQEGGRMYARPSLTFILHSNGQLGEMKGRGNNKPNEEYHPYIMRLLAQKNLVKGIEGGGYLPENNFSLNDLNNERLEAIFNARPDLQINDTTSLKKVIRYYISKDKELPKGFLNLQTAHGSYPLPADIAFEYGNFLMDKNKELPHILFQSIGKDSIYSLSFAEYMMDNDMEIPEILLHAISQDGERSFDLASKFFEKNKEIPEILINGIVGFSSLSMRLLSLYLNTNRKTKWEERLLESISKRPDNSNEFTRLLIKKGMEIPEVITKSVDRNPFDATKFASIMIKAGRRVPENVIYTISTNSESSEIMAEYMVRHDYKNIPEIILKSILENDKMTKDFVDFLKKQNKELPPLFATK